METNLKITIEQLKNYLGTGLKIMDGWGDVRNFKYTHLDDNGNHGEIFGVKPICHRLSDLDKFIPELGFVPIEELNNERIKLTLYRWESEERTSIVFDTAIHGYNIISSFGRVQKLFQWHFWPFGEEYFEQGLVIDKLKQK
jgi:hypothetical protein